MMMYFRDYQNKGRFIMIKLKNALQLFMIGVGQTHIGLDFSLRQFIFIIYDDLALVNNQKQSQVPIKKKIQRGFV